MSKEVGAGGRFDIFLDSEINERKEINVHFFRKIDILQLILLSQVLEFLTFLTSLVLVSYKPVSYTKMF